MAITSIKAGALELLSTTYSVGNDSLYALLAGSVADARLVQMADRYPAYVGKTQNHARSHCWSSCSLALPHSGARTTTHSSRP